MDLTRIFTIGGKPGLQKLVAQSKNGVIVESLDDKKRFNASSSSKISSLEDISVFCVNEDKPLKEVLVLIGEKNNFKAIDIPTDSDLKSTLGTYVAKLDDDRVYASDVKKIFKWYNLLIESGILIKEEKEEKKPAATKAEEKEKPAAKAVTAKKPAAKKSAAQTAAGAKKKVNTKAAPAKKTASTAKKGA